MIKNCLYVFTGLSLICFIVMNVFLKKLDIKILAAFIVAVIVHPSLAEGVELSPNKMRLEFIDSNLMLNESPIKETQNFGARHRLSLQDSQLFSKGCPESSIGFASGVMSNLDNSEPIANKTTNQHTGNSYSSREKVCEKTGITHYLLVFLITVSGTLLAGAIILTIQERWLRSIFKT